MIIGLTGKKRSGKDTAANYFVAKGFIKIELARPLKIWLAQINPVLPFPYMSSGNTTVLLYYIMVFIKNRRVPRYDDIIKYIPEDIVKDAFPYIRYLLQYTGTELVVNNDKYFWVNIVINEIKKYQDYTNIVISDIRFNHEVEALQKEFKKLSIIEITRDVNLDVNSNHISELGIDRKYINYTVSNDSQVVSLYNNLQICLDKIMRG